MSAKQKWIFGAVVLVFVLIIAGFGYQELKKEQEKQLREKTEENNSVKEETYEKALDFTVWNQEGKEVKLSEILNGKPAVMNFWTSKCPPCKEEMPDFQKIYEEMGEDIEFIMVDGVGAMGETEETGKAYVEEQGFTFPVYYDLEMNAIMTYGIQAFPTTFFINKDGEIVTGARGMLTKENILKGIEMIRE